MGFWSDLGSAIGSICSAIGSVCSAIGGAIASKIGALATTIAPFLGPVAQAVVAIAQIIGIFIKDDNVEDLGEAMRKADKKPEDFDSINDYITYLRAEIKSGNITLDTNKTEMQKGIDTAIGTGLGIKAIDEKYQLQTSGEFWIFGAKKAEEGKLDANEINAMLKTASEKNLSPEDMKNYVEDKELSSEVEKSEVSTALKESLQEANPSLSKEEITEKFNELIKDS